MSEEHIRGAGWPSGRMPTQVPGMASHFPPSLSPVATGGRPAGDDADPCRQGRHRPREYPTGRGVRVRAARKPLLGDRP